MQQGNGSENGQQAEKRYNGKDDATDAHSERGGKAILAGHGEGSSGDHEKARARTYRTES